MSTFEYILKRYVGFNNKNIVFYKLNEKKTHENYFRHMDQ